jgi:hypothetical protein
LDRYVGHQAVWCRTVPVVLAGSEVDAVAGPDLLDWAALTLASADPLKHKDRLT